VKVYGEKKKKIAGINEISGAGGLGKIKVLAKERLASSPGSKKRGRAS